MRLGIRKTLIEDAGQEAVFLRDTFSSIVVRDVAVFVVQCAEAIMPSPGPGSVGTGGKEKARPALIAAIALVSYRCLHVPLTVAWQKRLLMVISQYRVS